jgi:hypothetical protein
MNAKFNTDEGRSRIDLLHTPKIDLSRIQITILTFAESNFVCGSPALRPDLLMAARQLRKLASVAERPQ